MIIIEMMLIASGFYILFLDIKMKNTMEIPTYLVSGKINLEAAKDKPGYINYMYPRLIVFSLVIIVFSGLLLVGDFVAIPPILTAVSYIAYVVLLVFFSVISVKAQNKFLFGNVK